jgi:hypothetical protein
VQLAVQAQEATVAGAGHAHASTSAGVRVTAETSSTPPASPLASAAASSTALSRADADELASEAMRAVQAEDLGKAARLMGKAARAFPAEYGEAFELIETARRSVGAEMEPDSPVASPHASFADAKPVAGGAAAAAARQKLNEAASPVAAPAAATAVPGAGTPHGTPERKAARKHRGGGGGGGGPASPEKAPARATGAATPPPAAPRPAPPPATTPAPTATAAAAASPAAASQAPAAASDAAAPVVGAPAEDGAMPPLEGDDDADDADDAADADVDVPTDWTWSMVAVALWHVWSAFVEEYLPLVPEAAGRADLERSLRASLQRGAPARNRIVAAASALAALLAALIVTLALALARVALGWAASALIFGWQLTASLVRAVAWEPVWWAALPACIVAGTQSHIPLVAHFWASPAWWWLLGGRKWAALGTALALGTQLLLGSIPSWLAIVAWTLLRVACIFTSLWLRVPAIVIVLAAWAFAFLLWLHALAASSRNGSESVPPGELPVDVPDDAEGEVARILGCRTYYDVLELDAATDEESVRKAHRRKALLVHPDKCAAPHAQLAFQRVQDAFQLLKGALGLCVVLRCARACLETLAADAMHHPSAFRFGAADKTSKREYDNLLAEAAYAREQAAQGHHAAQHATSPAHHAGGAAGGSDGGGAPRTRRSRKGGMRR